MQDYPFFYAKVDMKLLEQYAVDKTIIKRDIDKRHYDTASYLRIPVKKYSISIKTDPNLITKSVIQKLGFNSKYIFMIGEYMYSSSVEEFDGIDGVWCLITHCADCFHSFLGMPRSNQKTETGCPTYTCANNLQLREHMKQQNRFLEILDP